MIPQSVIEATSENLMEIYSEIHTELIQNIARRFDATQDITSVNIAQWQVEMLSDVGGLNAENMRLLKKYSSRTEREIINILTKSGFKAIESDELIYNRAAKLGLLEAKPLPIQLSPRLRRVLEAAIQNARSALNLINTTALESSREAFMRIVNKAYLEVSTGVKSYQQSVRESVRHLAQDGIKGINYLSAKGRKTRAQVDVAVRRAVLTSSSQLTGQMQVERAREWGANLVEVTSHAGARPEHAKWQGRIYSLDGETAEYPNLARVTGYGTKEGLKGIHCQHDFYPYFKGISRQTYKPYPLEESEKQYEARQEQRKWERTIRADKREILAAEALKDDELKRQAQLKLKEHESKLTAHLSATGRTRRSNRQQVEGFGPKEAAAARRVKQAKALNSSDGT